MLAYGSSPVRISHKTIPKENTSTCISKWLFVNCTIILEFCIHGISMHQPTTIVLELFLKPPHIMYVHAWAYHIHIVSSMCVLKRASYVVCILKKYKRFNLKLNHAHKLSSMQIYKSASNSFKFQCQIQATEKFTCHGKLLWIQKVAGITEKFWLIF